MRKDQLATIDLPQRRSYSLCTLYREDPLMRKLWMAVLTTLLSLAFFAAGSSAAHAFGAEVLGCGPYPGSTWTATQCSGVGGTYEQFSAHNLSGTYSYQWTLTYSSGTPITSSCSPLTTTPCISSGCTSTSSACVILTEDAVQTKTYVANLRLTQSGQSRTISASAVVTPYPEACRTC